MEEDELDAFEKAAKEAGGTRVEQFKRVQTDIAKSRAAKRQKSSV